MMERVDMKTGESFTINAPFVSRTVINLEATDVGELYSNAVDKIKESIASFLKNGSGWRFKSVVKFQINMATFRPLRGNSYIPLPEKLAKKVAIINLKNKDNECFKWAITRALYPKERNAERIDSDLRKRAEKLNWTDINFPVNLNDIKTFEKNNEGIYVNVFGYEEDIFYPLRHTKHIEAIDLLLISEGEKTHYCWIKNFNRLMSVKTGKSLKSHNSMYYCKRCLNGFTYEDGLANHQEFCNEEEAIRRLLPKPNIWLKFSHDNRSMRVPFVIYADFESCIKPINTCEPDSNESYTKEIQEHIPISFVIYVKSHDGSIYKSRNEKITATNEDDDVGQIFIDKLEGIVKNIHENIKKKKMIITEEEEASFKAAINCHICGKVLGEDRVRDHDHMSGKYRRAAHNDCNLNHKIPKFIPVFFHNLSGYDAHLFVKKLRTVNGCEVNCIPRTEEKYISFNKKVEVYEYRENEAAKSTEIELRFLDTFNFMAASLDSLVSNTAACGKCKNCKLAKKPCLFPTDINLKITKSLYSDSDDQLDPETYKTAHLNGVINNRSITLREKIDRRKLEYILAHSDDFDLGSRIIKRRKMNKAGQITLLKEYLANTNSHGEVLMGYRQRNCFGRYWTASSLGIQNMSRKIRHTLCADYMYDIDIKNAHPTLLLWYCKKNEIKCEGLDAYITHRDEYIADYMKQYNMSRDDVKVHLLAILNGRKVRLDPDCPEWYKKFYISMQHIMDKIVEMHPELYDFAKNLKKLETPHII